MPKLPTGPAPIRNIFQLIGLVRHVKTDALALMMNTMQQHGDTFMIDVFGQLQVYTMNAEMVREITVTHAAHFQKDKDYTNPQRGLARFLGNGLLTSNGEFWKRQRKLVAPALHTKRIEAYAQTMVDYTAEALERWETHANWDIHREMSRLTMRIVAKSLFDLDVQQVMDVVYRAISDLQSWALEVQLSPLPTWLPTPLERKARRAKRDLDGFIYEAIRERRQNPVDTGDLLSMLLLAEDEDGNRMTDEQARDEIVTLFLAGHETTANALSWALLLLAQNPAVEAKLHAELDTVLHGALPTLADVRRLPYTEMVIKEAMRLYPPAWSFSRELLSDMQIGGYDIPKGTIVGVFTYAMHRSPQYWRDPELFQPERFSPENESSIPKYAYIPFGAGQRVCIGNSFAMMEAVLILATITQRYRFALPPDFQIRTSAQITLNPKDGLPMRLTQRERQPLLAEPML